MIMTEKEASTKTCPMLRYCVNPNQVYESNFAVYDNSPCIATVCPAWRWYDEDACYPEYCSYPRRGYCGMAGPVKYT